MGKFGVLLLAIWLFLTSLVSAQEKIRWDFNNPQEITSAGNFEKWQVQDGLFTGKTKWDPILALSLPKEGIDAAKLNFLTVRLYSSSAASTIEIGYNSPNKDWSLGRSLPVVPGWAVYTIDLNKVIWSLEEGSGPEAQVWGGRGKKVSTLRFDPGNEANRTVKIDWIELSGPEGKTAGVTREVSVETQNANKALGWSFAGDGDFLDWQPANFQNIEVKDGVIKGTTQRFSYLFSPDISVDASRYQVFVFTARANLAGSGNVYFKRGDETLSPYPGVPEYRTVPFSIIGDNKFHAYEVDLSRSRNWWQGTITGLRFDLTYTPDTNFEISGFRFLPKSEEQGLVPNGGFEITATKNQTYPEIWDTALQPGGSVSLKEVTGRGKSALLTIEKPNSQVSLKNKLDFDYLGIYQISADYKTEQFAAGDKLTLKLFFDDILGKPLKDKPVEYEIVLSKAKDWTKFSESFLLPQKAATGRIELSLSSPSGKSAVYLDNVILTLSEKNVGEGKNNLAMPFSWKADWIWKPDLNMDDKNPVYLRKVFSLPDVKEVERAGVVVTVDDRYTLYVNNRQVPHGPFYDTWSQTDIYDIKDYLQNGKNVIGLEVINTGGPAGALLEAGVRLKNGKNVAYLTTDESWKWSTKVSVDWSSPLLDDGNWSYAKSYGTSAGPPRGAPTPYVYFGPTTPVLVTGLSLPPSVTTGEDPAFNLDLESPEDFSPGSVLFLELVKEGALKGIPLLQKEIAGPKQGEKFSFQANLPLSKYYFLDPGKYNLKIGITGAHLTAQGKLAGVIEKDNFLMQPLEIKDDGKGIRNPKVRYDLVNGSPAIFINDKPHTVMNYLTCTITDSNTGVGSKKQIENCRDNNLHLHWIDAGSIVLKGEHNYDFSALDQMVTSLLTYDPDAYIVVCCILDGINNAGLKSWNEKYPDQLVKNAQGETDMPMYSGGKLKVLSLASETWMGLAEDVLRNLIRHVRSKRYGERVIGYLPSSGVTGEWFYWGGYGADPNKFVDYSEPFQQAFRKWAVGKYGDLASLNKTWQKNFSALDQVCIPSKEERMKSDEFSFLDPKASQYLIDLHEFFSELTVEDILRLAKVTKEETKSESLFGTYYGYVIYGLYYAGQKAMGHFALEKFLDSPDVDFAMSPSQYQDRIVGGSSGFMSVVDSFKLHHKFWVDQADLRTLHAGPEQAPQIRVDTMVDSKAVIARHFANSLINGCAEQWLDWNAGWIAGDPRLMDLVGRLQQIELDMMEVKRNTISGDNSIAVIVDEKSTFYTSFLANVHLEIVLGQYPALSKTGVGFDTYLLDDIEKMPPYKCYLFLNTFRITESQREFIDRNLKKDNKVLVFAYAPGFTDEKTLSVERMGRITGIKLEMVKEARALGIKTEKSDNPVMKYLSQETLYGFVGAYGPFFFPTEGEELGKITGLDKPGLVIKKYPDWTSIYSAAGPMPAALVRGIAEYAGIPVVNHSDAEGDVTFVGDRLVAVHTMAGGTRTLFFPKQEGIVKELITGEEFILKDGRISVNLTPRSTSIFFY